MSEDGWIKDLMYHSINTRISNLYDDLQTILRFHKNKYTVNSQLEYHVNEHSDLRN